MDAVIAIKMKAIGPGCYWGFRGVTWSSAATCNIDDWMQGLDEGATEREVGRTDDIHIHNYKWGHACTWHLQVADGKGNRECLGFLDAFPEVHSLLGSKFGSQKGLKLPTL